MTHCWKGLKKIIWFHPWISGYFSASDCREQQGVDEDCEHVQKESDQGLCFRLTNMPWIWHWPKPVRMENNANITQRYSLVEMSYFTSMLERKNRLRSTVSGIHHFFFFQNTKNHKNILDHSHYYSIHLSTFPWFCIHLFGCTFSQEYYFNYNWNLQKT